MIPLRHGLVTVLLASFVLVEEEKAIPFCGV
jgi:hypothetical protein